MTEDFSKSLVYTMLRLEIGTLSANHVPVLGADDQQGQDQS
jgi:hypothetical protein